MQLKACLQASARPRQGCPAELYSAVLAGAGRCRQVRLTMRPRAKELKVPSAASFRPKTPAQALTRRSMPAKRGSRAASALNVLALKMALELPMLTSQATPVQAKHGGVSTSGRCDS